MTRFLALSVAGLLLAGKPPFQELKTELLEKLGSATVLIRIEGVGQSRAGTGILILKQGTTGYVITTNQIAYGPYCDVVLQSGTGKEKSLKARVRVRNSIQNFACLELNEVPDLPEPLALDPVSDLKVTESAYVVGFPAANLPISKDRSPDPSFLKTQVSSIQKNASGTPIAVLIGGEINQGNSGGPMVTMDGRLIGMAVVNRGEGHAAYAIPSETIRGLLQGYVHSASFRKVGGGEGTAKYEVALEVFDPLNILKEAGIAYANEEEIRKELRPEGDLSWKPATSSMRTKVMKLDGRKLITTLEFARESGASVNSKPLVFQGFSFVSEARTQWTAPVAFEVFFGAGSEESAVSGRPWRGRLPVADILEDPDGPSRVPVGVGLNLPDQVSIVSELKVLSVYARLILSPDGRSLFALDLSEGQVYRLDPNTLQIAEQVEVMSSAVTMALTPDGKTLYIGGYRQNRLPDKVQHVGTIQAISTSDLKPKFIWETKTLINELVATDSGVLAATSRGPEAGLSILDVSDRSEIVLQEPRGYTVRLSPGQKRAYMSWYGSNPTNQGCVELKRQLGTYPVFPLPFSGGDGSGSFFEVSPDGRYLIGEVGSVMTFGKPAEKNSNIKAPLERSISIAMDPGSADLLISTADGYLKSYSLETFKLKKSVNLGYLCLQAVIDMPRRRLHAVVIPAGGTRDVRSRRLVSHVASFSLGN